MALFTKDSLDTLRQRIDLVEVISPHVDLKRSGSAYKAACPFHDEKTPSFMIQRGDHHYHCFGCGAHGDAIQFLMNYLKMNFYDAVESLAERFQVVLEYTDSKVKYTGPSKPLMKQALEFAARFFHFSLLHTPEGHAALEYLFSRGIDLDFIRQFQVGFAPTTPGLLRKILHEKSVSDEVMVAAGLLSLRASGGYRDFFSDRITFPIHHATGAVIGFSARKFKETTFGGKYVNTSETPLFKKSRVLFGLNHSRRQIAKDRKVIVVEGQLDALSLIYAGFNTTVAGQGTAFGGEQAQELIKLGINQTFLALDSDEAGFEAAVKIGNLFQKEGVEVRVVQLPIGSDPDSFLKAEGAEAFMTLLEDSIGYLDFLVDHHARAINITTPAGKNEIVRLISAQIREWTHPLMVHESLRKLAYLAQVPEHMVGVGESYTPNLHIRKSASVGLHQVDPVRILELDYLRWLLLMGAHNPRFVELAQDNIKPQDLRVDTCRRIYESLLENAKNQLPTDLLSLITDEEDQELIAELTQKKVDRSKAEEHFVDTIQKILDRNWMETREDIRRKIQSGTSSDAEVLDLIKQFDVLKRNQPRVARATSGANRT